MNANRKTHIQHCRQFFLDFQEKHRLLIRYVHEVAGTKSARHVCGHMVNYVDRLLSINGEMGDHGKGDLEAIRGRLAYEQDHDKVYKRVGVVVAFKTGDSTMVGFSRYHEAAEREPFDRYIGLEKAIRSAVEEPINQHVMGGDFSIPNSMYKKVLDLYEFARSERGQAYLSKALP